MSNGAVFAVVACIVCFYLTVAAAVGEVAPILRRIADAIEKRKS